ARSGRARNRPTRPAAADETPSADEPAERTAWSWDADAIHQSVLAGVLSQVGMQEATEPRSNRSGQGRPARPRQRAEYLGARGARFALWPASALAKKPATWVMAAELVETSRLWARDVARIRPEWAEEIGAHLVKRVYADPGWSARQGAATVTEKVFLYGVPLVADRRVLLAKTDPEAARDLFVRRALVDGEWRTHHRFWAENQRLLEEVRGLEARTRRGLLVDDEVLFDFYDERLPDGIVSTRHFDRWWDRTRRDQPDRLTFTREVLLGPDAEQIDAGAFPTVWPVGDTRLTVTYHFDPGGAADGVAVLVPITVLPRLDPDGFTWLVPGLRRELITATIRALPKPLRVALVPAPDTAAAVAAWLDDRADQPETFHQSFQQAFAQAVLAVRGVEIPVAAVDAEKLPGHLRVTFQVVSDAGVLLAEGKNLTALQRQLAAQAQDAVSQAVRTALRTAVDETLTGSSPRPAPAKRSARKARAEVPAPGTSPDGAAAPELEQTGLTSWPRFEGSLPLEVTVASPAGLVRGYPALADEDGAVALRVLADGTGAAASHRAGLRRLLVADIGLPTARITSRWTGTQALTLAASPYPSTQALVTDVQLAAVQALLPADVTAVRDADAYAAVRARVRQGLEDEVHAVVGTLVDVLTAWRDLDAALRDATSLALVATAADLRDQQRHLVYDGFVARTDPARLGHLVRYLRAATYRLERAGRDPYRDQALAAKVREVSDEIAAVGAAVGTDLARAAALDGLRWQVEELRVSLFAQQLGTPAPVSAQRIRKALAKV
ncbi:MAG: DUF3418 domain-containing protein, partial [Cellulomonas sp.]|nr:DUF3418 domain-containing protein [Cellulomonas sp.]